MPEVFNNSSLSENYQIRDQAEELKQIKSMMPNRVNLPIIEYQGHFRFLNEGPNPYYIPKGAHKISQNIVEVVEESEDGDSAQRLAELEIDMYR